MKKIIGFDYWQTISQAPELFRAIATALLLDGWEVHIVTAVGGGRKDTVRGDIEELMIPNSGVHVCLFNHPRKAPQLKLEKCQELGIEIFVDDRLDTCKLLNKNGILAFNIMRKDNRTYDYDKYPDEGVGA